MREINDNQASAEQPKNQLTPEAVSGVAPYSASARIEAMKAERQFRTLSEHPHLQAEAIANHYSKLAAMALSLREMVEFRAHAGIPNPEMDRAIKFITAKFAEYHREDFGIELSWPNA